MNMSRDAIMEEFWIFQEWKDDMFLHRQALDKILNMAE